jgi:cation diffusion facilitator CzcD-associated flavoprotein CzcO
MPTATIPPMQLCDVLILGAGMSGLCMAAQLRRAGNHDFVVVEQSPGLGGTWWDNRYPGAHVDVPAPLYAFSFAPNPRWSRRFAAAPEIQDYMQQVARDEGVLPHLRLGRRVTRAVFDEAQGRWLVDTVHGDDNTAEQWSARFFVCSMGPLSKPRLPDIEGMADFAGRVVHSARWDPAFDATGLRVGVIGTGSTAAQLIPPLAAQAQTLSVFQRTANWVLPRIDRPYGRLDHLLAGLPPYASAVRSLWFWVLEWGRRGFDEGTLARRGMQRAAEALLRRKVRDQGLRARLRPSYPLGCKRIIYSNDFHTALSRPTSELLTDRIERIVADGVRLAGGRVVKLDVLVCATGFDVEHSMAHLHIVGRGGVSLAQAWQAGPQAHRGLTVAGFPNLFLMLGPNTATGHTSTLLFIEPGVRWALRAMRETQRRQAATVEVSADAQHAFNEALQARLTGSVWSQCRSWYRADSGRNIAIWPGFTREYVRALARCRFEGYRFA